ncbi:hypothetical protein BCR35DRAFT_94195 [Leucosporidium creatinivorum]|uniref:Zn(2)-C6 fungal-type domain-containing protein n=1 Tax=Leucosporidium creatinivorum TaxID=106004 RepID=A0A1Y2F7A0_9BASI|nr:hypothetical protein BCR35DRAFT_94195 [Leucosporidium creatinivorum]
MTPPIPVGAERQRPAKSCARCRSAKSKCTGFNDAELAALEEDLSRTNGRKCDRCLRLNVECVFLPSKRKGRPRRLPKEGETNTTTTSQSASPSDQQRAAAQLPSPSASGSLSPSPSPSPPPVPQPPQSYQINSPPVFAPSSTFIPPSPPRDTTYDDLAEAHLARIAPYAALLPPTLIECSAYLCQAGNHLHHAIRSLLDPNKVTVDQLTPLEDLGTRLDDLQAAVLSVFLSYGIGVKMVAKERLTWVCERLAQVGWEGDEAKDYGYGQWNETVRRLGWMCWGLEIQLGVLTGSRERVLGNVYPSQSASLSRFVVQRTKNPSIDSLHRQALALLYEATSTSPLDAPTAHARAQTLITSAHSLYVQAAAYYTSTRTEAAFMTAIMSSAATIFLLSSSSIFSTFAAPAFACGIDSTSKPPASAHGLIVAAAQQIIAIVRASLDPSFPPPVHSPFFGCGLLIAVRGLLIGNEGEGQGVQEGTEREVQLVEGVLQGQAGLWQEARSLLNEVGLLRRTLLVG